MFLTDGKNLKIHGFTFHAHLGTEVDRHHPSCPRVSGHLQTDQSSLLMSHCQPRTHREGEETLRGVSLGNFNPSESGAVVYSCPSSDVIQFHKKMHFNLRHLRATKRKTSLLHIDSYFYIFLSFRHAIAHLQHYGSEYMHVFTYLHICVCNYKEHRGYQLESRGEHKGWREQK